MTFGQYGDIGALGRSVGGGFSDLARRSDVVGDALALATASVRLRVRNRLVVRALRDGGDYDEQWLTMAAGLEFVALASEKERDVAALEPVIAAARARRGEAQHPADYRAGDVRTLRRRRKTLRRLALQLRASAEDAAVLRSLVLEARQDALEDVAAAVATRGARARGPAELLLPAARDAALASLADDLRALARLPAARDPAADG